MSILSFFSGNGRLAPLYLPLMLMLACAGLGPAPVNAQALQFTQVTSFTPPYSPDYFALTGDVNNDGKQDLVVLTSGGGSGNPPTAYVLLGNGDGSFDFTNSYPIGNFPTQPALADLRGNGDLDLIVPTLNNVNVLLGNGDGTFQPLVSYSISAEGATGLTVGDFNGDKKLDLAVAVYNTIHSGFAESVEVFPGNGDGTFGAPITTTLLNNFPRQMTSGDFNGDGKQDIALDCCTGLQILLGNGDGTFQTGATYSVEGFGNIVAVDFNGDGILDLAEVSGTSITSTQVSVLLGNGDGTFQAPTSIAVGIADNGLVAADMNGDGKIDLVVGNSTGFAVWLGNGNGTFTLNTTVPLTGTTTDQTSVAVADFKTGSPPGVAATTLNSAFVFVQGTSPVLLRNTGSLSFASQTPGTTSSAQSLTLTNIGTATLTFSGFAISGANAGSFAETNNCTTLAANASCKVNVTFTPNAAGAQDATLTITDNAPGTPQTTALSGTGADFSLSLTSQNGITITPGQAANYSVSVSGTTGFTPNVTLTCSGAPPQSTCNVTPSAVMSGATANVAVVTAAASKGLALPVGGASTNHPVGLCAVFSGALGLALLLQILPYCRKWRPRQLYGLTLPLLLVLGVTMTACGGGGSSGGGSTGTPAGTYNLTVTGSYTAGSVTLTHSTKLTVIVQ